MTMTWEDWRIKNKRLIRISHNSFQDVAFNDVNPLIWNGQHESEKDVTFVCLWLTLIMIMTYIVERKKNQHGLNFQKEHKFWIHIKPEETHFPKKKFQRLLVFQWFCFYCGFIFPEHLLFARCIWNMPALLTK